MAGCSGLARKIYAVTSAQWQNLLLDKETQESAWFLVWQPFRNELLPGRGSALELPDFKDFSGACRVS